jgi:hypothetical protein
METGAHSPQSFLSSLHAIYFRHIVDVLKCRHPHLSLDTFLFSSYLIVDAVLRKVKDLHIPHVDLEPGI